MSRRLVVILTVAWLVTGGSTAGAQVLSAQPAGLAAEMPRVYAPYLANVSRIRLLEKPPHRPARIATAATTFQVVGPPFVPRKLATNLGKTSWDRQEIEATLTRCLAQYAGGTRQRSAAFQDLARALVYFLATNHAVFSEGKRPPTQAQLDASRAAIRASMLADERFREMSDMQKQEAFETLVVLAGFVDLGYGAAKQIGDRAAAARFQEMARQNLEALLGVPAERVRFTSAGLTITAP
jgi:hypothetical protein